MSSHLRGLVYTTGLAVVLGVVLLTACGRQDAQSQTPVALPGPPPAAAASSVGRYQIVTIHEGDRATVVMMLDTVEGATWIYRPPTGQAINGFWSDIPRLTYAPDFWRQVFAQQQQQAQQQIQSTTPPAPPTNPPPARVILPPAK